MFGVVDSLHSELVCPYFGALRQLIKRFDLLLQLGFGRGQLWLVPIFNCKEIKKIKSLVGGCSFNGSGFHSTT